MNVAIIAAAGQGRRMGGERAKQFIELAGIPLIVHTLRPFEQCDLIHEIILVLPAQQSAEFLSFANKHGLRKLAKIVAGGATRAESVLRGLQAVRTTTIDIVAVHDGVRPFVKADEIARTIDAAKISGAAILAAAPSDTIKAVAEGVVKSTLPRNELRRALTPQCFRYSLFRRAYDQADVSDPDLTDDSLLMERLGHPVTVVEGSSWNIKITRREDLAIADALLKQVQT